ncbi:DUF2188 domain-containing protein [Cytobacillus purgationiresistens]|uniref:Uncharacterized protein YdaT n=1 Tax=Cytobacillus purgationiresistens TaxID=863449 RepID=A0ABU0AF10_9BACI|nr:DUF2188 domain-containing protein [Cytobacillus purgationiresistens]MDQ0269844.1 uncharacterized protein YdaT [Cytobacillus purgationiresistens]
MPWNTNNYPDSLKNLDTAIRKKTIEIGNAMMKDGYDEGRAIPIAINQAKEWHNNADQKEINKIIQASDKNLQSDEKSQDSGAQRMDEGQHVLPHKDGWAVQTDNGKRPSGVFETKEAAINRAREIAQKKETHLIIHSQDGDIQEKTSYETK